MELDIKNPVNERILEIILKNNVQDLNFNVVDLRCSSLTGEGFLSKIFRICMRATKRREEASDIQDFCQSFIAKVPLPVDHVIGQTIHLEDLLTNEIDAYQCVIPFFKHHFGHNSLPFPRCYYAKRDFLVQDDLASSGFFKASRLHGLDFKHCRLAIEKIARFHAMSLVCQNSPYRKEYQDLTRLMKEQVYTLEKNKTFVQLSHLFDKMNDRLKNVFLTAEQLETLQTILNSKQLIFEKVCEVIQNGGEYHVLCHCDYYVNNMLFKYDQMEVTDVSVVDLQTVAVSSAIRDFTYFVTNNRFHRDHNERNEERLLKIYVDSVNNNIESLAKCIPMKKSYMKLSKMKESLRTYRIFTFLTSIWLLDVLVVKNLFEATKSDSELEIIVKEYKRLLDLFKTQDLLNT